MKILVTVFLMAVCASYGLELKVTENPSSYIEQDYYVYCTNGAAQETVVNLLDGDAETIYRNSYVWRAGKMAYLPIEVSFDKESFVDQVAFRFEAASQLSNIAGIRYQCKCMSSKGRLETVGGFWKMERVNDYQVFTAGLLKAVNWEFELIPVTSSPLKIGIREIEFRRNNIKYIVENTGVVKDKVRKYYAQMQAERVMSMLGSINEIGFSNTADAELSAWTKQGVNTAELKVFPYPHGFALHMEFTSDGTNGGKIIAGKWEGKIRKAAGPLPGNALYHFTDSVEVGNWKVDDDGYLCIKIGNGGWKKEQKKLLSFIGTDMEGVDKISAGNFWK